PQQQRAAQAPSVEANVAEGETDEDEGEEENPGRPSGEAAGDDEPRKRRRRGRRGGRRNRRDGEDGVRAPSPAGEDGLTEAQTEAVAS
ncbi:hypothetical protein, partial [Pseudoxanthomonas sp. KAs_5_3]